MPGPVLEKSGTQDGAFESKCLNQLWGAGTGELYKHICGLLAFLMFTIHYLPLFWLMLAPL